MLCLLIILLAIACLALYISIINTRGKNTLQILMLLLAHEENGNNDYIEITNGKDPVAVRKLLRSLAKRGYIDQRILVTVTAPRRTHVRELYKLTPNGLEFAKRIKASLLRRKR